MGYKETISRNQVMLVDLENMVAEDSECRVIDIFCETLDMAKLGVQVFRAQRDRLSSVFAESVAETVSVWFAEPYMFIRQVIYRGKKKHRGHMADKRLETKQEDALLF